MVWTLLFRNGEQQGQIYIKRFRMDTATKRSQNMLGAANSSIALLTDTARPRVRIEFSATDALRHDPLTIDCETFVDVKVSGFKSKGRRVAMWEVEDVVEETPLPDVSEDDTDIDNPAGDTPDADTGTQDTMPEETTEKAEQAENLDPDAGKTEQEIIDEITGQLSFKFED